MTELDRAVAAIARDEAQESADAGLPAPSPVARDVFARLVRHLITARGSTKPSTSDTRAELAAERSDARAKRRRSAQPKTSTITHQGQFE